MADTPESILARADRAERAARSAESLRATIRLRGRVFWRIRRTVSLGKHNVVLGTWDVDLAPGEIDALYDALAAVRESKNREARDLRARIEVRDA